LKQMKPFIEEGVHSRIIIKALRRALQIAKDKINELSVKIDKNDMNKQIELLEECAATSMSSKLIHQQKKHFSQLVVKAVMMLDTLLPLNMIGIKKVRHKECKRNYLSETLLQNKRKDMYATWFRNFFFFLILWYTLQRIPPFPSRYTSLSYNLRYYVFTVVTSQLRDMRTAHL